MDNFAVIAFSVVVLAVIWRPAPSKRRARRGIPCVPYLGECVPPETPGQREDRERWAALRELLSNGGH